LVIKDYGCYLSGILDICLYKHVHSRNLMDAKINLAAITIVAVSMALFPLIVNQSANAVTKCEDESGKSHAWIEGCKQGWSDHDHCKSYNGGTGEVAKGYKVGWSKGSCK
jgi:hypothetical protein